ncbi:hypothetical protein [Streptomyces sp. NPDC014685]|uniref:hypothetical protein n=1 Tax=Streptomyces sp. NPDC014685 TaxID=3364881 RepID=UPI0036F5F06C
MGITVSKNRKGAVAVSLMALAALLLQGCSDRSVKCTGEAQCGDGNNRNEGTKRVAELELVKVIAELEEGVSGETSRNGEKPEKSDDFRGVHIKVTVKDLGDRPAFISKATVTFEKSGYLKPCYGIGGDLVSTATYDFIIPDDQPRDANKQFQHKVPFSLEKELNHEIPANKYELFTLTVGPKTIPDGGSPWFGVLHVTFLRDTGEKLKVGPLAVVNSGGNPAFYPEFDSNAWYIEEESVPGCTKENAELVSSVMKTPNLTPSPEFASLNKDLKKHI